MLLYIISMLKLLKFSMFFFHFISFLNLFHNLRIYLEKFKILLTFIDILIIRNFKISNHLHPREINFNFSYYQFLNMNYVTNLSHNYQQIEFYSYYCLKIEINFSKTLNI